MVDGKAGGAGMVGVNPNLEARNPKQKADGLNQRTQGLI